MRDYIDTIRTYMEADEIGVISGDDRTLVVELDNRTQTRPYSTLYHPEEANPIIGLIHNNQTYIKVLPLKE